MAINGVQKLVACSKEEDRQINTLIGKKVFEPILGELLPQHHGAVFVGCGDGDKPFDSAYLRLRALQVETNHREFARLHAIARNGGCIGMTPDFFKHFGRKPKWLPEDVTTAEEAAILAAVSFSWADGIRQLGDGLTVKGMTTVPMTFHVPCGIARDRGISVYEQVELAIRAKLTTRRMLRRLKPTLACFAFVNREDGTEQFWKVNKAEWIANRKELLHGSVLLEEVIISPFETTVQPMRNKHHQDFRVDV